MVIIIIIVYYHYCCPGLSPLSYLATNSSYLARKCSFSSALNTSIGKTNPCLLNDATVL